MKKRTYKIQGKEVSREIFFDFLTTGDWEVANLTKTTFGKLFEPPKSENVISIDKLKQYKR